jgi:hypothetical protein
VLDGDARILPARLGLGDVQRDGGPDLLRVARADRIEVYGADWKPLAADFDGVQGGKNRSADRFTLESNIWQNRLVPWLAERGVEVIRR